MEEDATKNGVDNTKDSLVDPPKRKDNFFGPKPRRRPSKNQKKRLFRVHSLERFTYLGIKCNFRKPIEVGCFSLDEMRNFQDDKSQLRYFVQPPAGKSFSYNLRAGYNTYIEKNDDVKEGLKHLLTWIINHREVFALKDQNAQQQCNDFSFNTDFISWRGHFTKFLITPYQLREPWKMAATLFKGTIFISEIETEKARFERVNRSEMHKEMCYWGYKFEDYMTKAPPPFSSSSSTAQGASDSEGTSDSEEPPSVVNSNEAYCSVVRTRLKYGGESFSVLVGAEVDCCIKGHPKGPPDNYIELKTSKMFATAKDKDKFCRYKLLKFWAQSFLSGLPKIVVGLRDDDGLVSATKDFSTLKIPSYSEDGCVVKWNETLCINFLHQFLSWVKKVVLVDDPNVVYTFSFDEPFQDVLLTVTEDGSDRILPIWFTDEFEDVPCTTSAS